ncbi:hypothetical protein PUNSTDRAFT_74859 [Punctularia strigosozonata HHB-11173 SS5]|uniref:Uncharacterized protein n=1 Tax=Punctularia strigosozonata (strain HHB-11173) TaxID=741275 RepID=R7S5B4_PUNST|nr:uncharacterized protein PUNSTDRAFT_74859 [Punctularia strigosozonata HHB-11173 SS5]EIN05097.1 hypothetical protein PUNSTDRAFT_74859 [Punctularia strigosozonata HHB-11173 SS5]
MYIENTVRYQAKSQEAGEEYAMMLPPGGHLVRDSQGQVYTVAMFHQMRCLDIIREDYATRRASPLRMHCLNYLRQSILCMADTRLESILQTGNRTVSLSSDYVCRDWTALYAAVEANGI